MKNTFWKLLDHCKIVIPIMQRDYAQGRENDKKVEVIRKVFLQSIKESLDTGEPLDFDFVYGNISDGVLTPLDGQQRLTTLFLLHWYFAVIEGRLDGNVKEKLNKFSYQTRVSSARFCEKLVTFCPESIITSEPLSITIKNQPWFFSTWHNDPTVKAMLNMLDEIQVKFEEFSSGYFDKLTDSDVIFFRFLNLEEFNLTDDLYIKMNARGKPLTDFENFKAQFEKYLSDFKPSYKERFSRSVDGKWTDMLWNDAKGEVDGAFMRYFDYITELGWYLNLAVDSSEKLPENDFNLKVIVFSDNGMLDFLFDSLDRWSEITDKVIYFENYFSKHDYQQSKVKLYREDVNLFDKCISQTLDNTDKLLLYGVILQLVGRVDKRKELRLLRNLLLNSIGDEVRTDNLPKMYKVIYNQFTNGIDLENLKPFNGYQITDEQEKAKFLMVNPLLEDELDHFEDHFLLRGRMSAITLDPNTLEKHRSAFETLFIKNIDRNTISRAMLCFGDYSQNISNDRWRFANSNETWKTIFTYSDVPKIKDCLFQLLNVFPSQSLEQIIEEWLINNNDFEKSWRYYFIKYPLMNICSQSTFVWYNDFNICMLSKSRLSSYWCDPYMNSLLETLKVNKVRITDEMLSIWITGYEVAPMIVNTCRIISTETGWSITSPKKKKYQEKYIQLCEKYSIIQNQITVNAKADKIYVMSDIIQEIILW